MHSIIGYYAVHYDHSGEAWNDGEAINFLMIVNNSKLIL